MGFKRHGIRILAGVLVGVASWCGGPAGGQSTPEPAIIPRPVEMEVHQGVFTITLKTPVVACGQAAEEARQLIDLLAPAMGGRLRLVERGPAEGAITLSLDAALKERLGKEGYRLQVTRRGVQTLRQLLPTQIFSRRPVRGVKWVLPCVQITDYPRFVWRGLLIDPARHFIPVEDVEKFIDAMAMHKFNRLQIHLTDDQGWRIEIRRYPRLVEVGGKRDYSGGPGGYYTQDDIRRLVAYAQRRHVVIVPEIEMPGHTGAARAAYPHILAESPDRLGRVLIPRPAAVTFMQNVLAEVMQLFPGRYIHIGGDEAAIGQWRQNAELAEQMRRLNLKDIHQLYGWFIGQMNEYLTQHGRRLVGWDEILRGGLSKDATVMCWRGMERGIAAARAGHDVVMAPTSHTYFDYRQAEGEKGLGRSVLTLEQVSRFEPVPACLTDEQARHVLGGQGQLWGELIKDEARREYMTYPRACALIEILWSPRNPDRQFNAFRRRLAKHLRRLEAAGIGFRPLDGPAPGSGGRRR